MTHNTKSWTEKTNSSAAPNSSGAQLGQQYIGQSMVFTSVESLVEQLRPNIPVHCIRPQILQETARWFLQNFPGDVLYAVKCNPEPVVLRYLSEAGIRHFDVASLTEVKLAARYTNGGKIYFMHPVKSRQAIRESYFEYGVRDFSLDSAEELQKIIEETGAATDLNLHVRMALPRGTAAHDLSGKFGAGVELAAQLLQAVDKIAAKTGVCFHVGSQCMNPDSYRRALKTAGQVIAKSGVDIDALDVGGGFPANYPGMTPPPLSRYMDAIKIGIEELNLSPKCQIWCEPGRAIVAEAGSLIVNVESRKGQSLYINDGIYGSLFDAGVLNTRYPTKLLRANGASHRAPFKSFSFYGPTCDSVDVMKGPFLLPEDVVEGDWIEIGQLGAYCISMQSKFNGFDDYLIAEVWDQPLLRMPDWQPKTDRRIGRQDTVWNLNMIAWAREAYEAQMN